MCQVWFRRRLISKLSSFNKNTCISFGQITYDKLGDMLLNT